jgi:hypothetical protein
MFGSYTWRTATLLGCGLLTAAAHAQSDASAHSPYVAVSGTVDEDDSSSANFEFGLPMGRSAWLFAGGGQQESSSGGEDLRSDVWRLGAGLGNERLELNASYVRRKDDSFKQGDWLLSLDWRGSRGGIGADCFVRHSDAETTTSIGRRRLAPRSIRITESLDGEGIGAHGDIDVTENVNLFASAMFYDYEDVASNHPYLSRLLFLSGSGVTREEAFLDRSFGIGATYRFASLSLTLQYLRDEAWQTEEKTDTGEVSMFVVFDDHWSLTPSLGYAKGDVGGGVVYGGIGIGYNW